MNRTYIADVTPGTRHRISGFVENLRNKRTMAFLVIKDGTTRVLPVAVPPTSTMERIVEKVPDILDKMEKRFDKKEDKEPC